MSYSLRHMVMLSLSHHKRITWRVLTSSILLLLVAGCASVTIKDNLAPGTPKGFVKFYFLRSKGIIGCRPAIYSIDSSGDVFEGQTSFWDIKNEVGFQLAKPPGSYHFSVRLGGADRQVHVRVEENKITPVRIRFSNVQSTTSYIGGRYGGYTTTTTFRMNLHVEDPIPVER